MQCTTRQPGCVINNVLIGESNQLFLFEGNYNQFSYLSNPEIVSITSKNNFVENVRRRRCFADHHKIPYLHVVIPCKPLVVRNKAPEPYRHNDRHRSFSRVDTHAGGLITGLCLHHGKHRL